MLLVVVGEALGVGSDLSGACEFGDVAGVVVGEGVGFEDSAVLQSVVDPDEAVSAP